MERRGGRHEGLHRLADALGGDLDDRVLVDRVVQRLAHLDIGQRVLLPFVTCGRTLKLQIVHPGRGKELHGQLRIGLQLGDAGVGYELGAVELAGLHLQDPRGIVGMISKLTHRDRATAGHPRPSPSSAGCARAHRGAALPALEHERAGADRMLGEGLRLLGVGRAGLGLEQLLRHDRRVEGGERRDDGGIGMLELEDDGPGPRSRPLRSSRSGSSRCRSSGRGRGRATTSRPRRSAACRRRT